MAYEKVKYNNEYNKQTYERLNILVKKGMKEQIEKRVKGNYNSINAYVNALIKSDIERITPEPEEQTIINLYRYGSPEAKEIIWNAAMKADKSMTKEEKNKYFDLYNNKVINMRDNNGTINM